MLILVKPYRYVSIIMTTVFLLKMSMGKSKSFKTIWVLIHLKIFIFKLPSTTMQWSSHGEKHFSQYIQTVKVTHFIKIGISELSSKSHKQTGEGASGVFGRSVIPQRSWVSSSQLHILPKVALSPGSLSCS